MWCVRSATRRKSSSNASLVRCTFSHHARRHPELNPQTHDNAVYFEALDAVKLVHGAEQNGYYGPSKHEPTQSTADLLKQLGRSTPKHGPREDPKKSKAYDRSNTFPDRYVSPAARVGSEYYKAMQELHNIEFQTIIIAREVARRSRDVVVLRRTFRRLFDHCYTARNVMQVLALAFQRPRSTEALQGLAQSIVKALYRARNHATDRRICSIYHTLITRLKKTDLFVDQVLYAAAAKFAARSRDLLAMKRVLYLCKNSGAETGFRTFRAIVAKFSIGINGFGEIRNGRWKHEDLLQVVLGFEGTKCRGGEMEDHHLETLLRRDQWGYLTAWIQILTHLRLPNELWREWKLWSADASPEYTRNWEHRVGYWAAHILATGSPHLALRVLHDAGLDFWSVDVGLRTRLFDALQLGTVAKVEHQALIAGPGATIITENDVAASLVDEDLRMKFEQDRSSI